MSSIEALGAQAQHPVAQTAPNAAQSPAVQNQASNANTAPRDPTRVAPAFEVAKQAEVTGQSVIATQVLEGAEKPAEDDPLKTEVPLIGEVTDAQARALAQAENLAKTPLSFVEKVAIISAVGAPDVSSQAEGGLGGDTASDLLGSTDVSPAGVALDVTR